jgi:hypothetical protein
VWQTEKGLSMSKIVIPGGMREAVNKDVQQAPWLDDGFLLSVLEAALRWLSENPVVPNRIQMQDVEAAAHHEPLHTTKWLSDILVEWQRRMFLAPEPKIPEGIQDLLYDPKDGPTKMGRNDAILEAFFRGKASR